MEFAGPLLGVRRVLRCLALMKSLPDGFHANVQHVIRNAYQASLDGFSDASRSNDGKRA
jgi:hypothetical protein